MSDLTPNLTPNLTPETPPTLPHGAQDGVSVFPPSQPTLTGFPRPHGRLWTP